MSSSPTCPRCGQPLALESPLGLCPVCLLQAGIPTAASLPVDRSRRFSPPSTQELAAYFPQLEILELVGQGGMGAVYRARQPNLDRIVALKILPPQTGGGDPGFAERFAREARALARLSHPAIVAVHDFGQAGPFPYLVMEYVDGVNLRHLLSAGKIAPPEALAIVPPVCDALQYAHDRGIVHRDIKPENILLGKNGAVKIADFGLAKLIGTEAPNFSLTGDRDVMGTPHYMAPEQVERPLEVDHRADIYSLGVVFYQMLTGELPLGRFAPPSRKVTIDVRLDEIVLRALEKEPEQRYQQATALKTEVETVATTTGASGTGARLSSGAILPVGSSNSATRPPAKHGIEYRSPQTLWGLPLIHIATGIEPATGKARVARGIVAIGHRAYGVVAIGGIACGGIALGGVAVAAFFGAGGLTIAPIAMGGTAIGYLTYASASLGVHAVGQNASDPVAQEFFARWAQPLIRGLLLTAFISGLGLNALPVWRAVASWRQKTRDFKSWLRPALWLAAAPFVLALNVGVLMSWHGARRWEDSTIHHQIVTGNRNVIVQGWLVELPDAMSLTAAKFDVIRTNPPPGVRSRQFLPPLRLPSGGSHTTVIALEPGGAGMRLRVAPTNHRAGYRFDIAATLEPRDGWARPDRAPQTSIRISEYVAANEPVFVDLGSFDRGLKNVAVFTFQPWSALAGSKSDPIATTLPSDVVSTAPSVPGFPPAENAPVATAAATTPSAPQLPPQPPTDFDLMDSDPEILQERLRRAEAHLQLQRARFEAGLLNGRMTSAAEQQVSRLKTKLAGDRLGFARGDVEIARKIFTEIQARRSAGVAMDSDFLDAESELRIAENRLRQQESRTSAEQIAVPVSGVPSPR